MNALDRKLDRLAARGYFEITPTEIVVRRFTVGTTEHTEYGPGIAITWAPTGQGSPRGGRHRFNPFCTRSVARRTIEECVDALLEATEPRRRDLFDMVEDRWADGARLVGFLLGFEVPA